MLGLQSQRNERLINEPGMARQGADKGPRRQLDKGPVHLIQLRKFQRNVGMICTGLSTAQLAYITHVAAKLTLPRGFTITYGA